MSVGYIKKTIPIITLDATCPEKCKLWNHESVELNLCISCNIEKGYYPIKFNSANHIYIECLYFYSNNQVGSL